MKLLQSLAKQDWRVSVSKAKELKFEILAAIDGGEQWYLVGACVFKRDAVAIAALPKLYALALEVMKADAHAQFEPDMMVRIEDWGRLAGLARAALDAANGAQ